MKKLFLIFFCGILLVNCNSNPVEKPKDLLDEDQMVSILYDLYLINAVKSSNVAYLKENNITPSKYILHKYKVDSLQFSRSDRYYATDIDVYENIYKRVTQKLQDNKAVLDSLMAKETKFENAEDFKKSDVAPVKLDASKSKRSIKKTLFTRKDSIKN